MHVLVLIIKHNEIDWGHVYCICYYENNTLNCLLVT